MFVIEVIPIVKSVGIDTLSYFTSKEIPLGAIVDIPLRKKIVKGIVTRVSKATDMKGDIKSAGFALKKLDKIKTSEFFSKEFMLMAEESANYFATSVGSIINILVPDYILKNVTKLKVKNNEKNKIEKNIEEKYAVQGDSEERYGTWKSLIRQEFAKKKSLFFIFPTIEEAKYAFTILEKGIEGYAYLLHGGMTSKEIVETWNKAIKEDHPVAIISTGGFLSFPRNDVGTMIIERESSRTYKVSRRPFLDIRYCAEILSEKKEISLYLADNFLRLETLYRKSEGEIIEASPFKWRSLSTAKDTLVDMRLYKSKEKSGFRILSDEVEGLLTRSKEQSENMIILATRRGVAPSTVCGDCQNIVTCNNCSSPVVLHRVGEKSFFLCHKCGERRSTEEYCKICGSWKLGTVGIGIDLVLEKIADKFPDITLFKIDADTSTNDTVIHNTISKFRAKPGSILIGTDMMLQYLHEKVENAAIISLDSLFSLPDFRIQERILHMLIRMRSLSTRDFVVQTRKADEKVFEYGLRGNTSDFLRSSLDDRKLFRYPPYSTLIKLTLEGKKDEIVKEMEKAQTALEPFEVEVFPAFTHTVRGNSVLHGLIRLQKEKWIDTSLLEKLRSLSPAVTIKVDPETLL